MFGSGAREGSTDQTDVDLYVEFEPGYHPGLGGFDLEDEFEALGRPVELCLKSLLKPRVRQEAVRDAVVLNAAA